MADSVITETTVLSAWGNQVAAEVNANTANVATAQADATQALTDAASAQTAADNAQTVADNAQGTADTNSAAIVTLNSTLATVQTTADAAAPITAEDAPSGQLQIGGIEMGDTGWRDVSADLENGWSGDNFYIRRIGPVVHVKGNISPTSATDATFYTPSTGFGHTDVPGEQSYFPAMETTSIRQGSVGVNGIRVSAQGDASNQTFTFQYVTDDAWPTTLPGVAA